MTVSSGKYRRNCANCCPITAKSTCFGLTATAGRRCGTRRTPTRWSSKLQPQIIINNRLDMSTHEQWVHQGQLLPNEDYYTPEQRIGAYDEKTPWETCMTLGTQWSWKPDDKIKSADEVIRILARCAGGDGNLLLDVGPMPDGRIEPRQVAVLRKQVGRVVGRMATAFTALAAARANPPEPLPARARETPFTSTFCVTPATPLNCQPLRATSNRHHC